MSDRSEFRLHAPYTPMGDQPQAIATLAEGVARGAPHQILEGVTGSGKTFTMANVIRAAARPTLVLSHNKTLAAQLYAELKGFFPENAVEYFVSYFDYYQPEAYLPTTDTFIEKDSSINDDLDRLRLAATHSLLTRPDVVVVASVSCIYGLGSPEDYRSLQIDLRRGQAIGRDEVLMALARTQYTRNDIEFRQACFRVRGDTVDIFPAYAESAVRLEFWGDEIERMVELDPLTGHTGAELESLYVSPAKHFVTPEEKLARAMVLIEEELEDRIRWFEERGKLLEAQRIKMRTEYDLELLREVGFCKGIENYSRFLSGREAGQRPFCLLDFFPEGWLTIIDESHVTLPQVRGMYNGDRARKEVLVEHGFRLPSALDNRPLRFDEFMDLLGPAIFVSATPGEFELRRAGAPVRQVIRPTGIVDPPVEVRPLKGQIDDLMEEVRARAERKERTLVTTLTKRTAEDLAEYLRSVGLEVKYLHSEIDTIERVEILRDLRQGKFDCLVGINLLREGLDLPEVSLVAVLDADKEGFLRSETSLIQTAGRAARHLEGKVILYADTVTDSMRRMIEVTEARRQAQIAYNQEHGIEPRAIVKEIQESLYDRMGDRVADRREETRMVAEGEEGLAALIAELEAEMTEAAQSLEFERAALLRDQIFELKVAGGEIAARPRGPVSYGQGAPGRRRKGKARGGGRRG